MSVECIICYENVDRCFVKCSCNTCVCDSCMKDYMENTSKEINKLPTCPLCYSEFTLHKSIIPCKRGSTKIRILLLLHTTYFYILLNTYIFIYYNIEALLQKLKVKALFVKKILLNF